MVGFMAIGAYGGAPLQPRNLAEGGCWPQPLKSHSLLTYRQALSHTSSTGTQNSTTSWEQTFGNTGGDISYSSHDTSSGALVNFR